MSFILDALRKSENERQQQADAEFATVPSGAESPRAPKWLWILGALLALNVAVLLGLLLRPDTPAPVVAAPPVPAAQSAAAPVPAVREPVPAGTVPDAREAFSERVAEARRSQPQATPAGEETPAAAPAAATPEPAATASVGDGAFASLPTLTEVRADNRLQLPDLHVDIHVYSPVPRERFVFINMAKYRENEVIREGPTITRIEADGVVLQYQGVSFILPRD
ncbi:MAG: general secretion pathway protein GspB, partial [Woeseiaceae bacterium]|nr:general secretion pathway protein GspB [Woeseiaceae bacterium]